jgi:hypothetical protein
MVFHLIGDLFEWGSEQFSGDIVEGPWAPGEKPDWAVRVLDNDEAASVRGASRHQADIIPFPGARRE